MISSSGSSNPTERTGHGLGQRHVHVQPDGISRLRILGMYLILQEHFYLFLFWQSVVSEGAPFILIALVCFLGSIPGRKASYFILDFKQEKEGILINRTLSARDGWGESS